MSLKPVDDQWSEEALNFFLDKIQQGGNKVIFKNETSAERMSAAVDIVWKETIVDNPVSLTYFTKFEKESLNFTFPIFIV